MRSLSGPRRVVRRLWVVVLCTAIAGAVAAALSGGPTSYIAEAALLVPGGGSGEPGRASEAQRLAATYAAVLGRDDGVTPEVAEAVGRTRTDVEGRIGIVNVSGTSVVLISYTAPDSDEAVLAVRTMVGLVTGEDPATSSVSPGTLTATRVPTEGQADQGVPALPIALMLGLALGVLLAVVLDRSDVRLEEPQEVADLVGAPATLLSSDEAAAGELASRWARHTTPADTIALVPVLPGDVASALRAYELLVPATDALEAAHLVLEPRTLTDEAHGHLLTTNPTAVVLVVRAGTSLRRVRAALPALRTVDARVLWCLVVPGSVRRRGRRPKHGATADGSPDGYTELHGVEADGQVDGPRPAVQRTQEAVSEPEQPASGPVSGLPLPVPDREPVRTTTPAVGRQAAAGQPLPAAVLASAPDDSTSAAADLSVAAAAPAHQVPPVASTPSPGPDAAAPPAAGTAEPGPDVASTVAMQHEPRTCTVFTPTGWPRRLAWDPAESAPGRDRGESADGLGWAEQPAAHRTLPTAPDGQRDSDPLPADR